MTPVATPDRSKASSPVGSGEKAEAERRNFIRAGLVIAGVILFGALLVTALYDPEPTPPPSATEVQEGRAPDIVPRPNSGTAPDSATDRGGSLQLVLLGVMVVAVAGIGVVIARGGGSKGRANRAAWRAAAAHAPPDDSSSDSTKPAASGARPRT